MLIKLLLTIAPFLLLARSMQDASGPSIPTQAYYTVDDGRSYFADDIAKMPPFEKDGKPAYRVHVFRCGTGAPFVSHLERYTPEAKAKLEQARAAGPNSDMSVFEEVAMTGLEVKRPLTGDRAWVRLSDYEAAAKITAPRCPDGTTNGIEPVYPD